MGHTKIRLKVGRHRKFQRIPWEDIPKDECLIFLTQKIIFQEVSGAGDEIRTHDIYLGNAKFRSV